MKKYYLTKDKITGMFARNSVYIYDLDGLRFYDEEIKGFFRSSLNITDLMEKLALEQAREIPESEVVLVLGFLPE